MSRVTGRVTQGPRSWSTDGESNDERRIRIPQIGRWGTDRDVTCTCPRLVVIDGSTRRLPRVCDDVLGYDLDDETSCRTVGIDFD